MARKVLLADDSVTAQNMGRRILVDAGYEVTTVNNGSSALKKITESKPDLIVLDVYMPGYGGLEVCQRIRESQDTARIPVLLTVGKLEPFKAEEVRRVRADAFIVKPFEASELLTALTKLEDRIVPQPSHRRRVGKSSPGDDGGREFGDAETGWKNRLTIPPPLHDQARDEEIISEPPAKTPENAAPSIEGMKEAEAAATSAANLPDEAARQEKLDEQKPEDRVDAQEQLKLGSEISSPNEEPATSAQPKLGEEEVAAALASLAPTGGNGTGGAHDSSREEQPAFATIAAAGSAQQFTGPRWIAEEVGLADDEALLILEEEMQKAFAAFAAADAASAPTEPAPAESSPEPQPAPPPIFEEASPVVEASSESVSTQNDLPAPAVTDGQQPDKAEGEAFAAAAGAEGTPASLNFEVVASTMPMETPVNLQAPDSSELAAAWASSKHVIESESVPEFTAQIAEVAAGNLEPPAQTEAPIQAAPDSTPSESEENGAIASIVDTVLAELKPKLMEEISKKMRKGKKE